MLTNQECMSLTGKQVVKDRLCTDPSLNTNCEKTENTVCLQGKDEVYFVDSCGNAANIYDSTKRNNIDYWKKVVPKEQACNSGNNNANSISCGNCNYFSGSVCKTYSRTEDSNSPKYGNNICRDLDCYDTYDGKDYKHGEAWCIYDENLKNGSALAGSRYWRHLCIEGKEIVEPCGDYRQEVCIQNTVNNEGVVFNFAKCRLNNWRQCLGLEKNECSKYPEDCFWNLSYRTRQEYHR